MMEFDIMTAIGTVGFPCAMCIYMMVTNNKTLAKLTESISANTSMLARLMDKFNHPAPGDNIEV